MAALQNGDEDDGFEVAPIRRNNQQFKRVYIGNLPKSYTTAKELESALVDLLKEQILSSQASDKDADSICIEAEIHGFAPNNTVSSRKKNIHALVGCGHHANVLIRNLHQTMWQGQRLVVQREKRNQTKGKQKSTTSSNRNNWNKKSGFGKSWSSPSVDPGRGQHRIEPEVKNEFHPIPIEQATEEIENVVEEEFANAEQFDEDPINVALASTAAASLLAAMNAFTVDDSHAAANTVLDRTNWEQPEAEQKEKSSSFQLKPMAELLADFGEADPNWKKMHVDVPTSLEENEGRATKNQLAPKGKAPIHISFTSFGFNKGAPKRMDGWSHRQPLLPLDCRDYPPVPHYLAWQDGLSGAVKRAMLHIPASASENGIHLQDYARNTVASQVWQALLDAQNKGGHGYASPLEMTIYLGSEAGRHRSVVACEWAATALRKLLRANANDAIVQPVSVGTFHRDLEAHRQQQRKTKDQGRRQKKNMDFAGEW